MATIAQITGKWVASAMAVFPVEKNTSNQDRTPDELLGIWRWLMVRARTSQGRSCDRA